MSVDSSNLLSIFLIRIFLSDTYQFEEDNIAALLDDSESGLGRPTKDNIVCILPTANPERHLIVTVHFTVERH